MSALRKIYAKDSYQKMMDKIKDGAQKGRYYAVNFIIATFPVDEPDKRFLLASEVLEKVNTKISNLFDKTLFSL
ncbi:hypothetical protein ACI65C_012158 [Semiaphis heraclei]